MQLSDVDIEIHKCNLCNEMIEKFPNSKTVSVGKRNDIVILGEAPANNGWRKSEIAWYYINHKLLPSGVVLQKLLDEIDLKIEDTYFLEAIKCYPKDRKYLSKCSENCRQFLIKKLDIIKPKVVLSLGDAATKSILDIKYKKFSDVVGKEFDVKWKGLKSPWIGTKNIWDLFYEIKLLDKDIYDRIKTIKGTEWTPKFASDVYDNVKKHKYFITNLGKCTQVDARPLPDSVYKEY